MFSLSAVVVVLRVAVTQQINSIFYEVRFVTERKEMRFSALFPRLHLFGGEHDEEITVIVITSV